MKILAIDTSCDETSVAVTEGMQVLSNVVSSQVRYHKKYGGVVPMLAGRLHAERIESIIAEALQKAQLNTKELDAIAVTYGPGLAPALQVGISTAREWATRLQLPLYGVNHMAGHIASCFAGTQSVEPVYPSLVLLVSGSHTELIKMESFIRCTILGETLDDALGEAYDKVARMLGLGYPGGKLLAQFADRGDEHAYDLPVPMKASKDLNFSYSGLKNACRLLIEAESPLTQEKVENIAASFQRVAQQAVLNKAEKALKQYPEVQQFLLGGGVAANGVLRAKLRKLLKAYDLELVHPTNLKLCGDNAAMIGVAAYLGIQEGQQPVAPDVLDRVPSLRLGA